MFQQIIKSSDLSNPDYYRYKNQFMQMGMMEGAAGLHAHLHMRMKEKHGRTAYGPPPKSGVDAFQNIFRNIGRA
jgi:hypothetical protein